MSTSYQMLLREIDSKLFDTINKVESTIYDLSRLDTQELFAGSERLSAERSSLFDRAALCSKRLKNARTEITTCKIAADLLGNTIVNVDSETILNINYAHQLKALLIVLNGNIKLMREKKSGA